VDFNGQLYIADTEDQGFGLDPAMFCPESETQLSEGDVPISQDAVLVVPETPEEDWPVAVEQEVAAVVGSAVPVVELMLEQPVADEEHQAAAHRRLGY
jgi:hypothetical protein